MFLLKYIFHFQWFWKFSCISANAPRAPIPHSSLSPLAANKGPGCQACEKCVENIAPAGMEIGSGNSLAWKERFPTRILSPKIKNLVGSSVETVSPSDFRLDNDDWNVILLQPRSIYVPLLALHPQRPGSHQQNLWHFNANYYQGHSVTHATLAYTSLMWPWSSQMSG